MTSLQEYQDQWQHDLAIDASQLGAESGKTVFLHAKYFNFYLTEAKAWRKLTKRHDVLRLLRWKYYLGFLTATEMATLHWEPYALKVVKSDSEIFLAADPLLSESQALVEEQHEKLQFLEAVVKTLNNRGFVIRDMIDWEKFSHGEN